MYPKKFKRNYLFSWVLFALALLFRVLHFPGASLLIILSASTISFLGLFLAASYYKTNKGMALVHIAVSVMTVYVLFRLQYWPGAILLFYPGLILSLGCIFFLFFKKESFTKEYILFIVYFAGFLLLYTTPTYKVFYATSLALSSEERRNTDYYAWDKYSWFLYIRGEYEQAAEANQKALEAATISPYGAPYSTTILQHGVLIKTKEWKEWKNEMPY